MGEASMDMKRTTEIDVRVVDLRSDTQSKPTQAMRAAMAAASDNDDVYREDPTIEKLERKIAEMFGKEAALFVVSGTMANLLGISCQCMTRGLEVIMGDKSHTFLKEQGGLSQFSGLHVRTLPNLSDGTFDLDLLEASIRTRNDPHEPWTGLISVENTHNICGGKVLPVEFMERLRAIATRHNIPIHLDGSRLLNAAAATGISCAELAKHADSVNFCFSKGVGSPIGSVLIGSRELIERAIRMRKALGGGWRKAGGLAAAALVGLQDAEERFRNDHKHARLFAQRLIEAGDGVLHVDLDGVHTNILVVEIIKPGLTADEFRGRLAQVNNKEEEDRKGVKVAVKSHHVGVKLVRFVMYSTITREEVELAADKVCYVLKEYQQQK